MKTLALALMVTSCATTPGYEHFDDVPYPYPDAETIWSDGAQLEVHYATLGSATAETPLVLLHPWGLSMMVWSDVAPQLAVDRQVVLVDLPGHGKSSKLATSYSMGRIARAVFDVTERLGIDRFVVVGNSLGGATALAMAEVDPKRLDRMILVASPGGRPFPAPMRTAARSIVNPKALETLSDEAWFIGLMIAERSSTPLAMRLRQDVSKLREAKEWLAWSRSSVRVLRVAARYEPKLETIEVPALVIHGEADLLVWRSANEMLAERLARARLEVMTDCGHMPEIDCPDRLATLIRTFLEPTAK